MIKIFSLIFLQIFIFSGKIIAQEKPLIREITGIRSLFEKHGMKGSILIVDREKNELLGYQPAVWDSGYLPASTFKIPNALIGLQTGVIDTGYIFKWDGKARSFSYWNKDMTLREAFRLSCVPCFQELAVKINPVRMKRYLDLIRFGNMDVHAENIDRFWLEGDSRITPRQQVDFLQRFYEEEFSFSPEVMKSVKSIMVIEEKPEYMLSGKTGWSIRNGNNYGWFVGILQIGEKVYFVATLIEPKDQKMISDFALARKTITMETFRLLGLIKSD